MCRGGAGDFLLSKGLCDDLSITFWNLQLFVPLVPIRDHFILMQFSLDSFFWNVQLLVPLVPTH
jgi:hypothetical protein